LPAATSLITRANAKSRDSGAPVPSWAVPASASGHADPEAWPGLRSLVRVQAERTSLASMVAGINVNTK